LYVCGWQVPVHCVAGVLRPPIGLSGKPVSGCRIRSRIGLARKTVPTSSSVIVPLCLSVARFLASSHLSNARLRYRECCYLKYCRTTSLFQTARQRYRLQRDLPKLSTAMQNGRAKELWQPLRGFVLVINRLLQPSQGSTTPLGGKAC
jgi:hypothetical protein